METIQPKAVIVIFGATGDLAKRKLYPSIHRLYNSGKLGDQFAVVGVGRRPWSNEDLRKVVKESVSPDDHEAKTDEFISHFYYHDFDVASPASYQALNTLLVDLEGTYNIPNNRMFYLAMAPEFFGTIAKFLKSEGVSETTGWSRLVIEKPFGHDLPSAKTLNEEIRSAFSEEQIYRIDHYLGKQMVQNIEVIRFANAIFEPLWTNRYISNIQITSSESLGVEDRARYYENSGALRDMVQNHMLQMVALLAMEPPIKLNTEEIRSEKRKVLRALRPISKEEIDQYFVRGQYESGSMAGKMVPSYLEEQNVDPNSNTETFVAGKLLIDNFRWAGVPFYIRTGKRLEKKSTQIIVQFKDIPMNLYYGNGNAMHPNLLVIHIQPDEGITLHLNARKLDGGTYAQPIRLDYQTNYNDIMNTPEAYEKLIHDCLLGDATNFAHWDEVALSWNFVDPISTHWSENKTLSPNYPAGSMGPKMADQLLEKDGYHWWNI
ncbi:glucose-6-phosphate dehydrogenase [Bacillus sp. NPDC077027]|uniref:glucose-6-phosphate dehydrogenase n=1 Tax=Bacillus sp. NPDC077027 TaxID=3390548 RepID=UPI003D04F3A7